MTTRFRSREDLPETQLMSQTQKTGGPTSSGPWTKYSLTESMSDTVTPKFQRKIADGAIINNPCSYSKVYVHVDGQGVYHSVRKSDGWWYHQSGAVTQHWMGNYVSSLGLPSAVPEDLITQTTDVLKQQAIANIAKTPWSFGEDVGEIKETLQFLRRPAASLAEVSKSFERKARNLYRRYGNRAKALSGAWAAHRFAMLPLQRSLEDIVESSFVRNRKEFDAGQRLSARSRMTLRETKTQKRDIGYAHFSESRNDEVTIHAYILYETKNPLKGWQYRYGLRLKDIPTTSWQLVPYSFMVDRVANVSNCITGITNLSDPSIRILAAGIVTTRDLKYSCEVLADTNPLWSSTCTGDVYNKDDFSYIRNTWTPTVSDTIPRIDFSGLVKDATSVIDLLALTTRRLKCL